MTKNDKFFASHLNNKKGLLFLAGIIILIISTTVSYLLITNKPKPKKKPSIGTLPIVKTIKLKATPREIIIPAMGTIRPAMEIKLHSLVRGKVIWTSKKLIEGGLVKKGEIIVKIDPQDYKLVLVTKKAQLQNALYDLKIEEGQQGIAKREWQILGQDMDATALEKELALRKPHIDQKKAALEAAKASVKIAELDLENTIIRAPFNGIIREVGVYPGDIATTTTDLAVIAGTDYYQIVLPVPVDRLKWLKIPGSPIKIHSVSDKIYRGKLIRIFSDLEEDSRMARVIAEIKNPLRLHKGSSRTNNSLLIGEFINAEITGAKIKNILQIPSSAVHDNNSIWLMKNNTLNIQNITILWRDSENIYAPAKDIEGNLIVSQISAPVEGMKIRTLPEPSMDNLNIEETKAGKNK